MAPRPSDGRRTAVGRPSDGRDARRPAVGRPPTALGALGAGEESKDRLRELVRTHRDRSAQEIVEAVIADTNRFRCRDRAADDVTIVVVKIA